MEYIVFIGFCCLFTIIIFKCTLFKNNFISRKYLFVIAIVRAITSLLYGHLSLKNNWGDTFVFFKAGKIMSRLFYEDPIAYFKMLTLKFIDPVKLGYTEIFGLDVMPFGTLTRSGFISRIHSLLSIISFDYYPTHAIIFSFISFIGIYLICFIFFKISPKTSFLSKFFVYFTPSILFWTSGAHKDALITFGLGMMLYTFYNCFIEKNFKYFIGFLFACAFSYYARNYTFYLFIPGLITFFAADRLKSILSPIWVYFLSFLGGLILFFGAPLINPKLNFLTKFVQVQEHFLNLNGKSNFYVKPLEPNFESFITAFPKALWRSITLPNFNYTEFYLAPFAAVENFLLIALALFSIKFINIKKLTKQELNAALLCLGFGFFFFTLIGLTVTNVGALTRYKSVGLIFIQFGFFFLIDTNQFIKFINKISPLKITNYGIR